MKRILTLFLTVSLLLTLALPVGAQTSVVYALGDVNGNGYIDAADALLVLRSTVIKMPPEDYLGDGFLAANVDGEGWPSSTDALLILKKVVGKIRHFPAEITEIAFEQPTPTDAPSYQGYDHMYFAANPDLGAYALVCTTYEEYLAFLDSEKILCHSVDVDKEAFLENMSAKFPKEYFDGGNGLLLYYLHGTNGSEFTSRRYSLVDRTYFADGELVVELRDIYPGTITHDGVHKLYVCKLMNFTNSVEKIHLQVNVLKYDPLTNQPATNFIHSIDF